MEMLHKQNLYFFQYSEGSGFVSSFAMQNWCVDSGKDSSRLKELAGKEISYAGCSCAVVEGRPQGVAEQ